MGVWASAFPRVNWESVCWPPEWWWSRHSPQYSLELPGCVWGWPLVKSTKTGDTDGPVGMLGWFWQASKSTTCVSICCLVLQLKTSKFVCKPFKSRFLISYNPQALPFIKPISLQNQFWGLNFQVLIPVTEGHNVELEPLTFYVWPLNL